MIGLVPQEFNFNQFERVQEIVVNQGGYYGVPRAVALKRSLKILTQLDLLDKRDTEARALSGGMKRRLMIARALIHQPKLLILDEPTAGVDLEIRHSMWNFLREINGSGTTIILTTHYLEEAESLCRNIAIINDGEIIEHAGMPQLLDRLHGDCFLMNVESPPDSLPEIEGIQLSFYEEDQIQVEVPAGYSLNKLFGELSAHGINVRSIRNKQNRLEQMFLKLIRQNGNGDAS